MPGHGIVHRRWALRGLERIRTSHGLDRDARQMGCERGGPGEYAEHSRAVSLGGELLGGSRLRRRGPQPGGRGRNPIDGDSSNADERCLERGTGEPPANTSSAGSFGGLAAVACPCVATGTYDAGSRGAGEPQIMAAVDHGGVWSAREIVAPPYDGTPSDYGDLNGLVCANVDTCLAVGTYQQGGDNGRGFHALSATETSGRWVSTEVPTPRDGAGSSAALNAMACPPEGGACVAVGDYGAGLPMSTAQR